MRGEGVREGCGDERGGCVGGGEERGVGMRGEGVREG